MSIETTTLEQYGEKQRVVMSPNQTLNEAIEQLTKHSYAENQAYLVVQLAEKQAVAMPFADLLPQIIRPLGYESLTSPLHTLPLTPADLVVRTDIPQSGLEVVDWVAARPASKVVVVDDSGVVGLLVNPNRSGGFFDGPSLYRLHGELVKASQPHKTFAQTMPPPTCPQCQKTGFAKFRGGQYSCTQCDYKKEQPW